MRDFTRSERRALHDLASEAHGRELHEALGDLDSAFAEWRNGHIDGFELSEFVYEFYEEMSRDLYVQYTHSDPGLLVARAVARGLLEESEVPKPLLSALRDLVTYWREHAEEPDTA